MISNTVSTISKAQWVGISILFLLCAFVLRWPTIPFIDSAPQDPNFPLHALAAKGLSEGYIFHLPYLEWPSGAPVRYIAWPVLILAAPLNLFFSAISSMNIGVFLWVWIQGLGAFFLGTRWKYPFHSCLLLGIGCMFSPVHVLAMGNGQYENMAMFPLLWFLFALSKKKSCILPFALCIFSSPYQGICALLALPFFISYDRKKIWKPLLEVTSILGLTYIYYHAVSQGNVHESVMPAPAILSEKALLDAMFLPYNIAENGGVPLDGPLQRLQKIRILPVASEYNHRWPWKLSTAGSYIGLTYWIAVAMLWKKGLEHKKILLWALLCLICSLGSSLGNTGIPLPWAITTWLPGLSQMQATSRLLCGLSLALLLLAIQNPKKYILIFLPLLILEGLLISPAHWPIPAKAPLPAANLQDIDEPVAFWPAAPVIASHKVTMTAVMLEQPVALFADKDIQMPNEKGKVRYAEHRKNRTGQSLTEWKEHICTTRVQALIQFRDIVGDNGQPFFQGVQTMNTHCQASFCRWQLCETPESP